MTATDTGKYKCSINFDLTKVISEEVDLQITRPPIIVDITETNVDIIMSSFGIFLIYSRWFSYFFPGACNRRTNCESIVQRFWISHTGKFVVIFPVWFNLKYLCLVSNKMNIKVFSLSLFITRKSCGKEIMKKFCFLREIHLGKLGFCFDSGKITPSFAN